MQNINTGETLLRVENLNKWYGKIHALKDFNFSINSGEVVGIIGDNGAGKSTFIKILSGAVQKSKGDIFWNNENIEINSIVDARKLGIETVYQEQALIEKLDVSTNVFLGREITKGGFIRILDKKSMYEQTHNITTKLGLTMEPAQEVRFCSGGERQGVAVARAILFSAKLVILDEPTRALSPKGIKRVVEFTKDLKEKGIAVIIISHVFTSLFDVIDRYIGLSRGYEIFEKKKSETDVDELIESIISAEEKIV